jgi:dimethylargininase
VWAGLIGVPTRLVVRPPDPTTVGAWADYGWRSAPDPDSLAREHSGFCDVIRSAGGEVLEGTTPVPGDPDAIYVRDPVLMTPRGVVLLHPGKKLRRAEPAAVARDLRGLGVPVLATMEPPATAEGGDMFFLDATTLLVGRSYRTNEAGIASLRALLPEVEVMAFDLPHLNGDSEVLHLMSLISPLREGLAVGYVPLLPVRLVQLLAERAVSLVEVPEEEFDSMAANVLAVGPNQAVAIDGNPLTRSRLERAGVEVHVYRGDEVSRKGDGGPTCLTLPLLPGA